LIRADVAHEIDASRAHVLLVFVSPESDAGAALHGGLTEDIRPIGERTVATWRAQLGDPAHLTVATIEPWIGKLLLSHRSAPGLHPKVRQMLPVIQGEVVGSRRLSLKRVAAIAGLSDSRFLHVFTESVGIPLRRYVRWLRLQLADAEIAQGTTATDAAFRAGFADASHLSRTVRQMLGTTLSNLHRPTAQRAAFASDLSVVSAFRTISGAAAERNDAGRPAAHQQAFR
jgi:AraC-like DNA-binding protein